MRLGLCYGSAPPPISCPISYPLLVIPLLCLLGPATLSLCLSRRMLVCSVSGKRMSCPDSGNAQSIEISGREGLGPWLLLERGLDVGLLCLGGQWGNRESPRLGPASDSWVRLAGPRVTFALWVGVSHPREENPGGWTSLLPSLLCVFSGLSFYSSLPGFSPFELAWILAVSPLCLLGTGQDGTGRGWVVGGDRLPAGSIR